MPCRIVYRLENTSSLTSLTQQSDEAPELYTLRTLELKRNVVGGGIPMHHRCVRTSKNEFVLGGGGHEAE